MEPISPFVRYTLRIVWRIHSSTQAECISDFVDTLCVLAFKLPSGKDIRPWRSKIVVLSLYVTTGVVGKMSQGKSNPNTQRIPLVWLPKDCLEEVYTRFGRFWNGMQGFHNASVSAPGSLFLLAQSVTVFYFFQDGGTKQQTDARLWSFRGPCLFGRQVEWRSEDSWPTIDNSLNPEHH